MTLHTFNDFEQGSSEWHDVRRGIVTASVVSRLITPTLKVADNDTSRGLTNQLAAERITGWSDDSNYYGDDMARGHDSEPHAIDAYERHAKVTVHSTGFMIRDDWGYPIGLSPDGLVSNEGLLEIKAPRSKKHLATVLAGEVPREHIPQIQCALLVSGRDWCDFISYCGGMRLYPLRVTPDPKWHKAIVDAVAAFEEAVAHITATYHARTAGLPMTERVLDLDAPVELKLA